MNYAFGYTYKIYAASIIRPKIYIKFKKPTDGIEPMHSMTPFHLSTPTLPVLGLQTDIFKR